MNEKSLKCPHHDGQVTLEKIPNRFTIRMTCRRCGSTALVTELEIIAAPSIADLIHERMKEAGNFVRPRKEKDISYFPEHLLEEPDGEEKDIIKIKTPVAQDLVVGDGSKFTEAETYFHYLTPRRKLTL